MSLKGRLKIHSLGRPKSDTSNTHINRTELYRMAINKNFQKTLEQIMLIDN